MPGYMGYFIFLTGSSGIDQSLESERAGFASGPTISLARYSMSLSLAWPHLYKGSNTHLRVVVRNSKLLIGRHCVLPNSKPSSTASGTQQALSKYL